MTSLTNPASQRVLSVDVLRGVTIAFMILVNDPGDWDHVYGQLDHAPWNGFTATDLTPFSGAGQPVEKGAEVIVRMATIGKDGPTGTFWENEGELAW